MTLFEYLAVSVSIVLSLGVIRILDGLPLVLSRDRRHWIHVLWVGNVLGMHIQLWWMFWSYHGVVAWSYPKFILVLIAPAIAYSLALTLVTRDPDGIVSWLDHFYRVRTRFFFLFALAFCGIALSTWTVLDQPFLHPVRAIQASFIAFFFIGARFSHPRLHAILPVVMLALFVLAIVFVFNEPAPLIPGG